MIRVGVVDDHPITRWGIQTALASARDIEVVGGYETPAQVPAEPLDVVTLDLFLADDLPCIGVVGELAARTRVLMVTASRGTGDIEACFRAGARGYVHKGAGTEVLVDAVRTVAAGGTVSVPVATAGAADGAPSLSPREHQVLHFIANGYTHDQAARRLGVSPHTVDTYVKRLRAKLGVGNKADLTRAALRIAAGAGSPGLVTGSAGSAVGSPGSAVGSPGSAVGSPGSAQGAGG